MKTLSACVILALGTALAAAQESTAWPQFRGPGGSGVAEGQKPPIEFGPDKNVKWKVPTPSGFSSPIVVGDLARPWTAPSTRGSCTRSPIAGPTAPRRGGLKPRRRRSSGITRPRPARPRRRRRPTASGSSRTSARAAASSAATSPAKNSGGMRCRPSKLSPASVRACRRSWRTVSSSSSAMRSATRRSSPRSTLPTAR